MTAPKVRRKSIQLGLILLIVAVAWTMLGASRPTVEARERLQATPTPAAGDEPLEAPDRVEVEPEARDEEIEARLQSILDATGWFVNPDVRVQDGVVFLGGLTESQEFKTWAGDLARRTQDVAAVVNQIEILEPSIWDFEPALTGLRDQLRGAIRALPLIGLSLLILVIAWFVARLAISTIRESLRRRHVNPLLRNVIARAMGLVVFLFGLYVVFYVAGLTGVALTVIGGTGLLGLVVGIAFRDISENFLASVFLSVQNPFRSGDLVDIGGTEGFVQTLTTRATVLMTPDGNHVQIPNAMVYKSVIHNYTSNPNRREEFAVGIGYDDSVPRAQEIALQVLADHPAVLADPEPLVLVESLGASTVNLRIYFWFDGSQHSLLKVKSSVIRLVKRALQEAEISLPGEERALTIQDEVPIRLIQPEEADEEAPREQARRAPAPAEEMASISTDAEGGLSSEAPKIEQQARQSRQPEEGENLLRPDGDKK